MTQLPELTGEKKSMVSLRRDKAERIASSGSLDAVLPPNGSLACLSSASSEASSFKSQLVSLGLMPTDSDYSEFDDPHEQQMRKERSDIQLIWGLDDQGEPTLRGLGALAPPLEDDLEAPNIMPGLEDLFSESTLNFRHSSTSDRAVLDLMTEQMSAEQQQFFARSSTDLKSSEYYGEFPKRSLTGSKPSFGGDLLDDGVQGVDGDADVNDAEGGEGPQVLRSRKMLLSKSVTEGSDVRYSEDDFLGEDDFEIPHFSDDEDNESDYIEEDVAVEADDSPRETNVRLSLGGRIIAGRDPSKRNSLRGGVKVLGNDALRTQSAGNLRLGDLKGRRKKGMLGKTKKNKGVGAMRTKSENFGDMDLGDLSEVDDDLVSMKKYLRSIAEKRYEIRDGEDVWGEKLHQTPDLEPGLYLCGNRVYVGSSGEDGEVTGVDEKKDRYEIELSKPRDDGTKLIYACQADLRPHLSIFARDATGTTPAIFFEVKRRRSNRLAVGDTSLCVGHDLALPTPAKPAPLAVPLNMPTNPR